MSPRLADLRGLPVRARIALLALAALATTIPARAGLALDLSDAFALRDGAEITPALELGFSGALSLSLLPGETHGIGARLRASTSYVDDDKFAVFEVISADYHSVYRASRDHYEDGGMPTFSLFDLAVQLRATRGLHLIYGAAVARSGALTHATTAGLDFCLGAALPIYGQRAATMRDYHRAYFQLEVLPLVGSFLSNVREDPATDQEHPTVQVQGEVAVTGRVETVVGTLSAGARLSGSYVHQRSLYVELRSRWVTPTFWRRVALVLQTQVLLPLRPVRGFLSEDAQLLYWEPNVTLSLGVVVCLGRPPSVRQEILDRYHERRDRRRERFRQRRLQPRLR
jgi:hypothetical protein